MKSLYRIGFGFDIHPFKKGGPLILGGVRIPSPIGLRGHSDADALLHALCDSILGALSLGDIGQHFPSSDVRWKNTPSRIFIEKALQLARQKGYRIGNVDACIICERPKISPHYSAMRKRIGELLKIPVNCVGLKSKTAERLGSLGRGQGLAVMANILLVRR